MPVEILCRRGGAVEVVYRFGLYPPPTHRGYQMAARTVNNLPPAATRDDAVRCLQAIELCKKSWVVAVNTPLSDKISRYTLKGCDWKALLELIERIPPATHGDSLRTCQPSVGHTSILGAQRVFGVPLHPRVEVDMDGPMSGRQSNQRLLRSAHLSECQRQLNH